MTRAEDKGGSTFGRLVEHLERARMATTPQARARHAADARAEFDVAWRVFDRLRDELAELEQRVIRELAKT